MAKVAILGLGNIGTVYAAHLIAGGNHQVVACVRRPVSEVTVEEQAGSITSGITSVLSPSAASSVEWVLLCFKAQNTQHAEPWLSHLCRDETRIVILQNGIELEQRVRPFCKRGHLVPTVVLTNSKRLGPEHVRHMRPESDLAVPDSENGRALVSLFTGTKILVRPERDFISVAWRKFSINLVANPLTAIAGRAIGILRQPDMESLARAMLREAIAVGTAAGATFKPDAPEELLRWLASFPEDTGTSMLEDRLAGKALEHEAITGTLVRLGSRFKIPTPVNSVILALLRSLDP